MNGLAAATRLLVDTWAVAFTLGFVSNVILGVALTRTAFAWCWLGGAALAALSEALGARRRAGGTGGATEGQRLDAGGGTA